MAITNRQVWTTSDNVEHATEAKAKIHERALIIKSILDKQKNMKNTVDKVDLHSLINSLLDSIVKETHAQELLTTGFGVRSDF